jgi:hypothetical protein
MTSKEVYEKKNVGGQSIVASEARVHKAHCSFHAIRFSMDISA